MPLWVLSITAGDQVPSTPLGEMLSKVGTGVLPLQKGAIAGKLGVVIATTLIVKVTTVAVTHSVGFGTKVYTFVPITLKSTIAGVHVPDTPFCDTKGNTGTFGSLRHCTAIGSNTGVILGMTVTVIVVVLEQDVAFGVNV